jgi:hypothetical protein
MGERTLAPLVFNRLRKLIDEPRATPARVHPVIPLIVWYGT